MGDKKHKPTFYPGLHNIAMFIDLDNFSISHKRGFEIKTLLNSLYPWGKIVVRQAYGSKLTPKRYLYNQLLDNNFEVKVLDVTTPKKNSTDIHITMAVMDMIYTNPDIAIYALAAGDSDYLGLVRKLHRYKKFVIGFGSEANSSFALRKAYDLFLPCEEMGNSRKKVGNASIIRSSSKLPVDDSSIKKILRKRKLYPPDTVTRVSILKELCKIKKPEKYNFYKLQQILFDDCMKKGFSKTAVRNCLKNLVEAELLVKKEEKPLLSRKIIKLPDWQTMEQAICEVQIKILLSTPEIIPDPIEISKAVWNDTVHTQEVQKIMDSL